MKYLAILAALLTSLSAALAQSPPRLVLIGDSTVASYPESDPKRGWGQLLPEQVAPGTEIVNLAIPGATTKTFLASPNWPKALEYHDGLLLVQFGHNDGKIGKHPGAVAAEGEFRDNLRRIAAEARAAGLKPVFVTPMHRLKFESDGSLTTELSPYAEAMRSVAKESGIAVIDLYEASGKEFQPLGDKGSLGLNPSASDRVHFSEKGARLLASIIASQLALLEPATAKK